MALSSRRALSVPSCCLSAALPETAVRIAQRMMTAAVQAMRPQADRLILDIWNQVEHRFAGVLPVARRLELCRDYGVVYYYRSGEKGGEEEGV